MVGTNREIGPTLIDGATEVFVNGQTAGFIWMTDRGACYQHDSHDHLTDDDMEWIVDRMREIEKDTI